MLIPMIFACLCGLATAQIQTYYGWKYVDYLWDNETQREDAITSGLYNKSLIFADDFQLTCDGRTFVTAPRVRAANPSSLNVATDQMGEGGPLLKPYPNWEMNRPNDCDAMVDVIRVVVDKCNQLWAVDSGFSGGKRLCPPKILVFDLKTDKLLRTVEFPIEVSFNSTTGLGLLEVQEIRVRGDSCEKVQLFISDIYGFGLVIWDGEDVWRLSDEVFQAEPAHQSFSIAGDTFALSLGIAGSFIAPQGFLDKEYFFFRPVSSLSFYAATVDDLLRSKSGHPVTYFKSTVTSPSQQLSRAVTSDGIMFSTYGIDTKLACTNLQGKSPYADTILDENEELYNFATAVKVLETCGDGSSHLRLMTNRLGKVRLGNLNYNEVNFRVLGTDDVACLVQGTACEPAAHKAKSIKDKSFKLYKTTSYPNIKCVSTKQ